MAVKNRSKSTAREVEIASTGLDEGLRALNALAKQHGSGLDGETLAVCVERMTSSMLANVRTLYNIADGEPSHG